MFRDHVLLWATCAALGACGAPTTDRRAAAAPDAPPPAAPLHPRAAPACPQRVDLGPPLGQIDWCARTYWTSIGNVTLTGGVHDEWDHFDDGKFAHSGAQLLATAKGDFEGTGHDGVAVALAVQAGGMRCSLPSCDFLEVILVRANSAAIEDVRSHAWEAARAADDLRVGPGRVSFRSGKLTHTWVFGTHGAQATPAKATMTSPRAEPPRGPSAGAHVDDAACSDHKGLAGLGPWASFDWCNRLKTVFGTFQNGHAEYAESDVEGRFIDASRSTSELLRMGLGDFDGDGVVDLAILARNEESYHDNKVSSASSELAWTVYKWRDGAEPSVLAKETFPVAGRPRDLAGTSMFVGLRRLDISGRGDEPAYEWVFDPAAIPSL